jgi:type IV pilus assembly protein PilE
MHRKERGFTLMELMVVIVIVAILAAVAVPLYINYVRDAQRTEAKGAIGAVITAEQTYLQRNNTYTPTLANLNVNLADLATNWTFTIPAADAQSFTVLATGINTMAGLSVQCVYTRGQPAAWTEQ